MSIVEFGRFPGPTPKSNSCLYTKITEELRLHPKKWGKIAEVDGEKDLARWAAAMRSRGMRFAQRKIGENSWALWCMYDPEIQP